MGMASRVFLLALVSLLSGCTTLAAAPSVMALPGVGKPLEQFHAEDTFCRQWATQQAQETAQSAPPGQLSQSDTRQYWYDMAYLKCMNAKGNRAPGILTGSPPPATAPVPPSPAPPTGAALPPQAP